MAKLIRNDLYTQTAWAKKKGISKARVNQLVKSGDIEVIYINGGVVIKD